MEIFIDWEIDIRKFYLMTAVLVDKERWCFSCVVASHITLEY